jgi:bifunctional ADP-heptose synthase (sugar kinase/adenylyltransferase)
MVSDSQSSSQVEDVSRFIYMNILTPTEREARLVLKNFDSGLVVLDEKLRKRENAENVFITLDEEGVLIHAEDNNEDHYVTNKIAAMNTTSLDPAGVGDSLLTYSKMVLATGSDICQAVYLGSIVAACQVGRNGNIPLSVGDLYIESRL